MSNSLSPKKEWLDMAIEQVRRHIPRNDILIRLQRVQISVSHLGRNLESDM